MAIRILSNGVEVRKPGYTAYTGVSVIAGYPMNLGDFDSTGKTLIRADGTTQIIGFALETNVAPTSMSVYYDDYNRGTLISLVTGNGGELEIWDDGRGAPYDTTQSYKVNQALYVSTAGLVTNQSNGSVIGYVTKLPTSATDSLIFQITL
jgi:hypothetical protein